MLLLGPRTESPQRTFLRPLARGIQKPGILYSARVIVLLRAGMGKGGNTPLCQILESQSREGENDDGGFHFDLVGSPCQVRLCMRIRVATVVGLFGN